MSESEVESAALARLSEMGWQVRHGGEMAPDGLFAERQGYEQVVLPKRLGDALLPKIISGEIWVREAGRFLKARGL